MFKILPVPNDTFQGKATRDTRREGINSAVTDDVASIFRNKTHHQLLELKSKITAKIETGKYISKNFAVQSWWQLKSRTRATMVAT